MWRTAARSTSRATGAAHDEGERRSRHTFNLAAHAGQTVVLTFTGTEDSSQQTSFVIDDASVNVG